MQQTNRRLLTLAILAISLFFCLAIFLFTRQGKKESTVTITNISTCSSNIHPDTLGNLGTKIYASVKLANDYNKKETKKHYDATIRDKSCVTKLTKVKSSGGEEREVRNSTVIVDIPEARQSWKFTYDWLKAGTPIDTVINGATALCLPKQDLKFGDFNCEKVLSIGTYDTPNADPILQYMPYTGEGFRLEYDPDDKSVYVIFTPQAGNQDVATFNESTKAIIPYWFNKRGLDITKYNLVYGSNTNDD